VSHSEKCETLQPHKRVAPRISATYSRSKSRQSLSDRRVIKKKKIVTKSRTGLQIYEGHGDQLNRPGPMA
jgi:hypothetical protein